MEITCKPRLNAEKYVPELHQSFQKTEANTLRRLQILKKFTDPPITIKKIEADDRITDKHLLNGFQGSSIPLDEKSFNAILDISGTVFELDELLERSVVPRKSQGHQCDWYKN